MLTTGCVLILLVTSYVFSLPVPADNLDERDVKIMKCIAEVIADVLSKPSSMSVSQECLDALRTDDRLIYILRHQNFLKELQEIAGQGTTERNHQRDKGHVIGSLGEENIADRSMLAALKNPTEKAAEKLSHMVQRNDTKVREESNPESQEHNEFGRKQKKDKEELERRNHVNHNKDRVSQKDKRGSSAEKTHYLAPDRFEDNKQESFPSEDDVEKKKSEEQVKDENEEKRKGGEEQHAGALSISLEPPHHSKEESAEEVVELQMMARKQPFTEHKDEEGSGSHKPQQNTELDSLSAIESELESVAQKLHELRRG